MGRRRVFEGRAGAREDRWTLGYERTQGGGPIKRLPQGTNTENGGRKKKKEERKKRAGYRIRVQKGG